MLLTLSAEPAARATSFRSLFTRRDGRAEQRRLVPRDLGPTTRKEIVLSTDERPGTILIDTTDKTLGLIIGPDRALAYRVGIGREGFGWTGRVIIGGKAEWPNWRPPAEMRRRDPGLPDEVPPGPLNPLGARAIYLHKNGADTLYRIHGTNEPGTIGGEASSGCFRLSNADVIDLYDRVRIGSLVIVY
jgi:lipoprotein-anchoring transpeptidase ErfK/SrfK